MLVREAYVFVNLQGQDVVAGKIQHHREARGLERFYFVYGQSYLARKEAFSIDPRQLPLRPTTFVFDALPLAIQDAGPDEFGRLIFAKTRGEAQSPLDYHLANGRFGIGALAFSEQQALKETSLLVRFDALEDIADALNRLAASKPLPAPLENLLHPGSSLPGARPKALLVDDTGEQWIAKFGRDNDIFDIQIAEAAAMTVAAGCGIRVADHKLERVNGQTVYLTKRFDREQQFRTHYLSAYTLLGADKVNRDNYFEKYSYPALAELSHRISSEPTADCHELFKRMLFNALCANKDDHLKNHGFLIAEKGLYRLSPAFDIVPGAGSGDHAIGMGVDGAAATRKNLLSRATAFKVSLDDAEQLIEEVQRDVRKLIPQALEYGMADGDAEILQQRMENSLKHF